LAVLGRAQQGVVRLPRPCTADSSFRFGAGAWEGDDDARGASRGFADAGGAGGLSANLASLASVGDDDLECVAALLHAHDPKLAASFHALVQVRNVVVCARVQAGDRSPSRAAV
jgi:hypothetical protein